MTRDEYMRELTEKLSFMEEGPRQALLDFYSEMLADRMEDGMDELSAVAAMESPEEIAARQRAEWGEKAPEAEKPKEAAAEPMDDDALRFSSLADSVLKATEGILRQAQDTAEKAQQGAEELQNALEKDMEGDDWAQVAQKLRNTAEAAEHKDLDGLARKLREAADSVQSKATAATDGDYEQVVFTCPVGQLRGVRLECGEMPIQVKPCEGNQAKLTYYTRKEEPYEAAVQNGVLTLKKIEENGFGKGRFHLSILSGVIKIGWTKPAPTVELELPPDALVDLLAHTSNASIRVGGMQALCDVELKTSNSRIALENVTCKALEAHTSNGRLVLENVSSRKAFTGATSNARIEGENLKSGGEMRLTTSNSRLNLDGASSASHMTLVTSNGSVQVSRLFPGGTLEMRTSNGSITGILPGRQSDWSIQSHTSNGRNSLPTQQPGNKPLNVRTSNGSINLRFEE